MDTNQTRLDDSDPWTESGAMVYVTLTVATFSAVAMCCTWFITRHSTINSYFQGQTQYGVVDDSEEEIELCPSSKEVVEEDNSSAFTLEDPSDSGSEEEDTQTQPV